MDLKGRSVAGSEMGILPGGEREEVLLDGTDRDPTEEVERGSRLVVGTRGTTSSKGLLTNDGTSGLVVDVKVTSSVAESTRGSEKGGTVLGKDAASEGVRSGRIAKTESLLVLAGLVDKDGEEGTEELFLQEEAGGVARLKDSGLHEPSLGSVR